MKHATKNNARSTIDTVIKSSTMKAQALCQGPLSCAVELDDENAASQCASELVRLRGHVEGVIITLGEVADLPMSEIQTYLDEWTQRWSMRFSPYVEKILVIS